MRSSMRVVLCVLAVLMMILSVEAALPGFIKLKNGYFYDSVTGKAWVPRGVAYQTWNRPLGVWQTPDQLRYDLDEMVKMGANSIRVDFVWQHIEEQGDNIWSWANYDLLVQECEKRDIRIFALVGYQWPPNWFPDAWYTMHPPEIDAEGIQHTNRWQSDIIGYETPAARAQYAEFFTAVCSRYATNKAIAGWVLGNEYGYLGLWSGLLDGYDPNCEQAFRTWCQGKYTTITNANATWGTSYTNFNQLTFPEQYRAYGVEGAIWADATQWREDSIAGYTAMGARAARLADTNHLMSYSTVGMQWGEEDWRYHAEDRSKITAACAATNAALDFFSVNNYPWSILGHESQNGHWGISFTKKVAKVPVLYSETGFTSSETMWPGMTEQRQGPLIRNALWESLEAGAIGTHVFSWMDRPWITDREKGFGIVYADRSIKPAYWVCRDAYNLMTQAGLDDLLMASQDPKPDIAFLWTDANDSQYNRYECEMQQAAGALERLGYEPNFINLNELGAGAYTNYRVVILPRNMRVENVVPNSTNKTVLDFLRTVVIPKGVHVLAMADLPGLQDFNGKPRAAFVSEVSNLFGVDASDIGGFEAPMRRREYVSWYWAPIQVNFGSNAIGSVAGNYAYRPEVWKYSDEIKVTNGGVTWAQMDTLRNKGFEESNTSVTKWDGTWGNVQVRNNWGWQYDGLNMVQLWGDSGLWEDVPVVPFGRYTHSAYLRSNSDDPLSAGAYAVVQLEWRDEKGNILGTNESARLTGATPGNGWVQYKVDAIAPSNAWTGRRMIRCGLNATNGGTGSVYVDNKQWAPAAVVKNHGAGKSAIFLYSVGDNKPDGDADGQPDVLPWKYRYDILGAVVRDYFGVQPRLTCTGTNGYLCLPEYRTTSNNNVLIQMKNYAYNTSQPNGGANLTFTLNSSMLTGKTVRALEQGRILEQNSDGIITVSLAPDGHEMLYAYTPAGATNQVVQISDAPSVVHPYGDKVYTLKVKYDCVGRTDLRVRIAFMENGDNGDGVANEIYQVLTNNVTGSGEQVFYMWIPDANRADTDYKSTPDGGKYQFSAWLETTAGASVAKAVPMPTILEWGIRPTNALASTLTKGQTVAMNLEWEDLYESLWWRNTPQSRNDAYPGRVAVYRSLKTESQFPGHLAKVNAVCDWLNSLGYSQANALDIGFDNVIVTGLFSNDFNTGNVAAWTRAAGAMNWSAGTTTSGYLRVSRIGNDDNILITGTSTWPAVTVSADVRYNKQDPYFSDIELFPKYVDRNNYYKIGIRNYYGFWRIKYLVRVNGVIHQQGWLKEFPKTNRPVENVWYNLKVAQSGSTNSVYFNNSLVGTFYATNFLTGRIALGTRAAQLGIWEPQKGYFFIDDDENGFSADLNTNGLPLNLDWGYLQQFYPTVILPGTYVMNDKEAQNLNTWMTNGVHSVLATDGSVAMRNETGAADLGRVEALFGVASAVGSISGITQVVIGTNDHYVTLDYAAGATISVSGTGRPYTSLTRGKSLATVRNGSSALGLIANVVTNNRDAPGKAMVFNFAAETSGQLTNGLKKIAQRAFEWLRNDANKVRVELKYVSPLGNPGLDLVVYSTNVWILSGSGTTNLAVSLPSDGLMTGDGKFYWSAYTYPWDATNGWIAHNGFYSSGNDTAPLITIGGKGLQILGVTEKAFAGRDWDMWAAYNTRTTTVTLTYGIKEKALLQNEDNFNDGDYAGWNLVPHTNIQWSVTSSALQARVVSSPFGYAYIYRNGLSLTGQNVTVEYDTLFTSGARDGGMVYRGRVLYANPNTCGWADNTPNYYTNNGPATGAWSHVVVNIRDDVPYPLSDLYVNGRVVFLSEPIETTSWTTNTIGFLSPYSNANAVVQWDNVRVADEQYSLAYTNVAGEYVPSSAGAPTFWPSVPDYDPDMLEHNGTAGGARYEWYLYARGEGLHSFKDGAVYFSPRLMVEVAAFPTNFMVGNNVSVPVQWESLESSQVPARLRLRLFDAFSGVIYIERTATVATVSGTTNIAVTIPTMPSGSNYVWSTFLYLTNAVNPWTERLGSDDTFRFNELGVGVEPETRVTLVGPSVTGSVMGLYSDAGTLAGSSIFTWQGGTATFNGNYADATAPEGSMSFMTTGSSWQGWGVFSATNLAAYSNGYLKFWVKSSSQLKVDLEGPQNTKGTVYIASTTNQWREFVLPIASFANIKLTNMYGLFEITRESAGSYFVDNVRWDLYATAPNQAPVVNAGVAQTITLPSTATLSGTATDDGLPSNRLTVAWTKVSGPGTVTFANATNLNTTASFSTSGVYVLRLTANDAVLSSYSDVQITVNAQAPVNQAPVVNAGVDQTITLPSTATLAGTATDDGLPSGVLSVSWTKLSGPGTVTFTNATTANTRASFTTNGVYVLRLTATDTALSRTDDVQVTVNAAPVTNQAPVVNAGVDQTITLPSTATLAGTATDDGLPSGVLSVSWTKLSGPGAVTFTNAATANTRASFTTNGVYVLRLTATDTALSRTDDVQVTVNAIPVTNQAPVVNAGVDQTITLPSTATLNGTVTDDGLPSNTVTVMWSMASGPGTMTFTNQTTLNTRASFSASGVYVLRLIASDTALSRTDTVQITVNPIPNQAPVVNAGVDQTITLPSTATLAGTATDDGLPSGVLNVSWTKLSGPGTVTFTNAATANTRASFTTNGVYVLRLTATDTALSRTDDVQVTVNAATVVNQAPVVNAGVDQAVTLPWALVLAGTATDDGLPSNRLTVAWTKVSGPGTVTFTNAATANTRASFSTNGVYVLRLTATDTALSRTDDVQVTVNPALSLPPIVSGQSIVLYAETSPMNVVWGTDINTNQSPSSPNVLSFTNETAGEGTQSFKIKVNSNSFNVNWLRYPLVTYLDLSAYSNGRLNFMAKASKGLSVSIHIAENYDIMVHLSNGVYGFRTDNAWCSVSIPMSDYVAKGVNLSTLYGWLKFYGGVYEGVEGGEEYFIDRVFFSKAPVTNQAPVVNAGVDQTITLPSTATLVGTATDDGLPSNRLTVAWSKVSGPGTVTFTNAATANTRASFTTNGVYVLRLTATDTALSRTDDVQVTVNAAPVTNQAPVVNAGVDQTITLPSTATLVGTATDDGLPSNRLTVAWSKVSGPGTVTFTNAATANTRASFTTNGVYVLRLTASDTVLSRTDDIQVTVNVATGPVGAVVLTVGGASVTGTLAVASEVDWYTFTAPTTGVYSFVAQALTLTGGTRVALYGPNSSTNILGAWSTSPTAFTVVTPGTYYLTMSSLNGVSTGSYSMRVVASQVPWVNSMWFDSMVMSTPSRTVTVTNDCGGNPTEYMASESATFSGASWLTYSKGPTFTLSSNAGVKTVYFKVKNAYFESAVKSNTIQYVPPVMLTVGAGAVTGNVSVAGEEDWYQFTAAVTGAYTVVSQWGTMTNSCYVFVYGPNDHRPTFAAGLSQAVFTVSSVGTYYVRFSTWNGQGTGTYSLRVVASQAPWVNSMWFDSMVMSTPSRTVTLTNDCGGNPIQYMASESATFSGASWLTYSKGPTFTLSSNAGVKTVYFKVKNAYFESAVKSNTIQYAPPVMLTVNNGAVTGSVSWAGEEDWYQFTAAATGVYTAVSQWGTMTNSCYVFVYGPNDHRPTFAAGLSQAVFTVSSVGTYYARFSTWNGQGTGTYSLRITTPVSTNPVADLALTSLSVTRPTDAGLKTFTACSYTITNNGPATVTNESVFVDYYLSKDATFGNADDKKIGDTGFTLTIPSRGYSSIVLTSVGVSNMTRFWTQSLVTNGSYYVFAYVRVNDGSPSDSNLANNNTRSSSTIAFTPVVADVQMSNLSVTRPADGTLRTFTACSFTIANNGPTTITNEWVMMEYFISKDTVFGNADDTKIGDTGMTLSMSPGQGWNISLSGTGLSNMTRFWTANPLAGGNYYVFARAKVVDESPYDSTLTNDYVRTTATFAYTPEVTLAINGAYTAGNISVAGDADWFAFTVTTAGTVTIDTLAGTLTDNLMYLYGPNNTTTLIESDDDDGTGYMARIVRSLAVGTYHVKIVPYYLTGTGTYTIRVTQ